MQAEAGRIHAVNDATDESRNRLLADLYREHREPLFHFLLGLLRNRASADEALQQVFLKFLESWQSVRLETAKGWLFTAAYHEALAIRRRGKVADAALDALRATPVWQLGAERPDPAATAARRHEIEALRAALGELPELQREVVERRMVRNQPFIDIAREIGCPTNTVLSRMRLALEKLKRLLEISP